MEIAKLVTQKNANNIENQFENNYRKSLKFPAFKENIDWLFQ